VTVETNMATTKQAKPAAGGKARDRDVVDQMKQAAAAAGAAPPAPVPAPEVWAGGGPTPEAAAALADIAQRSTRLLQIYAERLQQEDGYQVIDPRTVAAAFQEFVRQAAADPAPIIKEQLALWTDLAQLWQRTASRIWSNAPATPVIAPAPQDKRFKSELWAENPFFDHVKQNYLLWSRFLQASVAGVQGVDPHTHRKMQFYTRQFVNALSPANFVATNPVVLKTTVESKGENLINGLRNLVEDLEQGDGRLNLKMANLGAFRFGENIASSPGKVVFQNDLMQLIQYAPATATVHRRPLLIVPPWINKFYILDLKPKNSFIKWCVDQGHTVFVVSWINPGPELGHKGFSDYLLEGPLAALDAIAQATGEDVVNVIGYCIGGTLTASTLAYMAAKNDKRIASVTFFTTLLDFSEVGDISVFIDDEQLKLADEHMNRLGYLEGRHMAEAFNLMRENDLIWFFIVNNYLMGREPAAFDLLYWNSDATRMPAKMHSFYLRNMYHRNVLKRPGGITLANVPIDLRKVEVPAYFVSTRDDHIAPWRSTYAGTRLVSGPVRFVLGASGHIAGVINPPSSGKYGYWTNDTLPAEPEAWLASAAAHQGSWWNDWTAWVAGHGDGQVPAREPGSGGLAAFEDAPGSYVQVRISS
jgi:polyhydroxyalkanoate synthase subunit PhaC